MLYKNNGYPNEEKEKMFGGSTVTVIKPDGTVTTEPAKYWGEVTKWHFTRGKSAGKGK